MNLFSENITDKELTSSNSSKIEGLYILFDFISKEEEEVLLNYIDQNSWLSDLKRRVQHFGYKYDYKARRLDNNYYIGEIPEWMRFLYKRLQEKKLISFNPDQAIVNEYKDNQGIAPHIDCEPCFGDTIISISLGGQCVMNFQRDIHADEGDKIPLLIPPRTLIIMSGEARYKWYHGIPQRKSDKFNDKLYKRTRRISITFRKVII